MVCHSCQHQVPDGAAYCPACGAPQDRSTSPSQPKRLTRSRRQRRLAGVCGGLAEYLGIDVTIVRAAWVVFAIVPGAIIGGVLAYLLAWLVIPEATADATTPEPLPQLLTRSATDRRIAGVCGGLAEYLQVDATPIRLLWVLLSVVPGAIVGGLIAYAVAWIIMPEARATLMPKASTV